MREAIGLMEYSSIAAGYLAQDFMLKAAQVEMVVARSICPGKYIIIISGDVEAVKSSLAAARENVAGFLVDELLIPNVHPSVLKAVSGTIELNPQERNALGIIESFSVSSILEPADQAAKAADVILFRVHLAMTIGGKGFLLLTGEVGAVRAAVSAGIVPVQERGLLTNYVVIPSPQPELFSEYI